jgi:haloalkane dehalogenase
MIPVLADAGFRVIAMDHIGMGRSDKPIDVDAYSYLGHIERLEAFIIALGLRDITLFVQDWGSLIGLHVAGENPEWFARLSVGNGILPVIPAGAVPFPPVEDPDEIDASLQSPFGFLPAQQPAFYDGCERLSPLEPYFGDWITFAMKSPDFRAGEVVEAMTYFDLPDAEEAAYDAPYPSRIYMTGARTFPSLINDVPGTNDAAWAGLTAYEKPFITIWASNDPGNQGGCEVQQSLIDNVPGAVGQAHTRLPEASHFLQDDQGEEIARRLVQFMADNPLEASRR